MEKQIYPFIDPRIEKYCEAMVSSETPNLTELDRQTHLRFVKPRMISGNWQGTLLKILSLLVKPQNILEIGTFTGYATICLAEGLAGNGIIHTIEVDREKETFLRTLFAANNLEGKIKLHIGNALDIIPALCESFDIIFIDADKASYPEYYHLCKDRLQHGGLLLADNVLWYGKVAMAQPPNDKQTQAILKFNHLVANDTDFDQVILPIRDGITLARKK